MVKKRAKGPGWSDHEGVETRELKWAGGYYPEMGRSSAKVICPFCNYSTRVYLWSFAGCGKRCDCGALMGWRGGAIHWEGEE